MRHVRLVLICVSMALLLQSCYTFQRVGSPTEVAIEITNEAQATPIKHFTRTKKIHHFVYGLVSPDDAGLEELISDAVKLNNGSAAVNVRMKYQQTFIDGLVGGLTLGIYTPFTLTVEGDVVK